jgi:hypothetical protein
MIRYIGSFLTDRERIRVSNTCGYLRTLTRVDCSPVIFDHIVQVRAKEGFARSINGYWYVADTQGPQEADLDADMLGYISALAPWHFVKRWAVIASHQSVTFWQQCVNSLCMSVEEWHADVLVALEAMLHCDHPTCPRFCRKVLAATDGQLIRQAIWQGRLDVMTALFKHGHLCADMNEGGPLRLALSTIGYENSESEILPLIDTLLDHGADPTRDFLWGLRLCLQRRFLQVAHCLCCSISSWPDGDAMLTTFACDIPLDEQKVFLMALHGSKII